MSFICAALKIKTICLKGINFIFSKKYLPYAASLQNTLGAFWCYFSELRILGYMIVEGSYFYYMILWKMVTFIYYLK